MTADAKSLKIVDNSENEFMIYQITVNIPGKPVVHFVPHDLVLVNRKDNRNQILTIKADLSVASNRKINAKWYEETLSLFRCGEKCTLASVGQDYEPTE